MGFDGAGKTEALTVAGPPVILRRACKGVFHIGNILRNPGDPLDR